MINYKAFILLLLFIAFTAIPVVVMIFNFDDTSVIVFAEDEENIKSESVEFDKDLQSWRLDLASNSFEAQVSEEPNFEYLSLFSSLCQDPASPPPRSN